MRVCVLLKGSHHILFEKFPAQLLACLIVREMCAADIFEVQEINIWQAVQTHWVPPSPPLPFVCTGILQSMLLNGVHIHKADNETGRFIQAHARFKKSSRFDLEMMLMVELVLWWNFHFTSPPAHHPLPQPSAQRSSPVCTPPLLPSPITDNCLLQHPKQPWQESNCYLSLPLFTAYMFVLLLIVHDNALTSRSAGGPIHFRLLLFPCDCFYLEIVTELS